MSAPRRDYRNELENLALDCCTEKGADPFTDPTTRALLAIARGEISEAVSHLTAMQGHARSVR